MVYEALTNDKETTTLFNKVTAFQWMILEKMASGGVCFSTCFEWACLDV